MKKVQPGELLEIKASTWNSFIDAANFVKALQSNQGSSSLKSGIHNGIVLVRNAESATWPQYGALVLADLAVKPNSNELEFKSGVPVFIGRRMATADEEPPYAVLLEPAEFGKLARALLLGVTPAKVTISESTHTFAVPTPNSASGALESSDEGVARILWKAGNSGSQWCLLQLGGAGSGGNAGVTMCQVNSSAGGVGYNVSVFSKGQTDGPTGYGKLFLPELALNSELPPGSWLIGHKALLKITGGNEQ